MNERPLVEELGDGKETPYQRYCRMFIGEGSLGALLRYEVMTGVLGPMPGALGYALRASCYRWLLHRIGRGSVFGRSVTLRCPAHISIGARVMIDDYVVLDAKGVTSSIELGDQILLGRHCILSCNEAMIRIGNFVSIGPFCFFASKSHITIGSNVSIGSGTHLMAAGHAYDVPDIPIIRQQRLSKGIVLDDGVWIGSGSKILDGVTIGRDSIVGAGSVVSKDVPAWSIVLGNPARVVQKRNQAS
jgi:acetyltransferase-like isoleucine patch superfamily enzyme